MFIPRQLEASVRTLIGKYPILAITGPRQSGKTTMLRQMFPDYTYLSLEDPDIRAFASSDTRGFLSHYGQQVIIDEAQQVPALFSYLQTIVDQVDTMGQYILSGSQNFHLMKQITQSLAGRVAIFRMFPFDLTELASTPFGPQDMYQAMLRGFYPALYSRDIPSKQFYANYVQTYVQRDVSQLIAIMDLRAFKNFLGLCAARAGQLLSLNNLANECGISQPTAKAWLSALESSYIVFLLYPWHQNFNKRITKTPKLYFYDTGLLSFLLKLSDTSNLITSNVKGALFENMMVAEYFKITYHRNQIPDAWFWRDSSGNEIDLLVQGEEGFIASELKATQTIYPHLFKGLNYFAELSKYNLVKNLVYGGDLNYVQAGINIKSWKNAF
jgi:predicted AAA+ superfamily ATPase